MCNSQPIFSGISFDRIFASSMALSGVSKSGLFTNMKYVKNQGNLYFFEK